MQLPQLIRPASAAMLIAVLICLAAPTFAQRLPQEGWSAPPPARSMESMRKWIRLGSDRGQSVKIKGVEITDSRFVPLLILVDIDGEKALGIHTARFTSDQGSFESELPTAANSRWQRGLPTAPTSTRATVTIRHSEERSFSIETKDAQMLMNSNTIDLTLIGRLQERNYTIKAKQLAVLKEWLEPRVKKHVKKAAGDGD